jgi:glycosyltransferase involved in cell wall biosynthesis
MGVWARGVARGACPFVALYHTALSDYAAIRGRRVAGPLAGRLLGGSMDLWLRSYFNAADLILAPSRSVQQHLAARLRPTVAVLGRGVDSVHFHPAKRKRGADRPRALYVGRVAPEKNLDLLARVFDGRDDCELMIVGDGPYVGVLRQRLPQAIFAGTLEGEPLARAYADADFFVFPSRTDTLGNVVLEAMASGLPVVVSDSMGPMELVEHGTRGFVTATEEEFACAVAALAGDESRRCSMGRAARRFAETRSWSAIFDELTRHYERLLSRPLAA